jgi:hypothetical protein
MMGRRTFRFVAGRAVAGFSRFGRYLGRGEGFGRSLARKLLVNRLFKRGGVSAVAGVFGKDLVYE